ncbi:MAG TPA: hypothetical protein VFI75_04160 [Candidatus Acidoferrum sp.]|jgi:hypothetical protein|nr:hypothetical protein [Candidatus Acidoferrum sp.]
MNRKDGDSISRREFARRASIVSAVSMVPSSFLAPDLLTSEQPSAQTQETPPLSPESQAEAEARYQSILVSYGNRLSSAQKFDVRRLCFLAQVPLDNVRKYAVDNGDAPALYFKPLVEREKKTTTVTLPGTATNPAKKR